MNKHREERAVVVTGGTVLTPFEVFSPGVVVIENGHITRVAEKGAAVPAGAETIDATGLYVAPGFIDLHTQGGCGHDVWMGTAEALEGWSRCQARHGVTSYMLTTGYGTTGYDFLVDNIELAAVAANPLGIYLESPFCSVEKRGGIDEKRVRPISMELLDEICRNSGGHLRMMTVAPEREGAIKIISELANRGIIVALGHTNCSWAEAEFAIDSGASHVTHCFNAMRPMHHRDPGPLPAFLGDDRVTIELVLDGIHVQKPVVNLAVRTKKTSGVCVITDNIRFAGIESPPRTFERMGRTLTIEGGVPLNEEGTISGSLLTMDRALKNVIAFTGLELNEALEMLTATPARAARVGDAKGQLKVGYDADLVIFDGDFTVHRTLVTGRTVYRRGESEG